MFKFRIKRGVIPVKENSFIFHHDESFICGGRDVVFERGEIFSNLIALSSGGICENVVELSAIDIDKVAARRTIFRQRIFHKINSLTDLNDRFFDNAAVVLVAEAGQINPRNFSLSTTAWSFGVQI